MSDTQHERAAINELVQRLRSFGHQSMNDDGELSVFQTNPLTGAAADMIESLVAHIERHQKAGDELALHLTHARYCFPDDNCTCLPGHAALLWTEARTRWCIDHG